VNRRLTALVIGVSDYPNGGTLKNPTNDAEDVAKAIENLGFSVISKFNSKKEDIDRSVQTFRDNLNGNEVGLFYFAGHGMQIKGENYLCAIDTDFKDEISAKHSSYPLNQIIEVMDSCSNQTNIIILDACRNNPYVRAWNRGSEQHGLASVYTPRGTLIAFATSPGEYASDGIGRNGSYTEALLKHISMHDLKVEDLFKRVRNTLNSITSGKQTSWEHTSLTGDFYFNISVGKSITIYSQEAIADSFFTQNESIPLVKIISDLKINSWNRQNAAISRLKLVNFTETDPDTLFVLGRNIYQAACGDAHSATVFISEFRSKFYGFSNENSKNILDGMLFEIFFDPLGKIRKDFKLSRFNKVFALKDFPEFSENFEFISEILLTYQNRFYLIPGKSGMASIDVVAEKNDDEEYLITEIHFEGFNILSKPDEDNFRPYPMSFENLIEMISNEMVIPESQLAVNPNFDIKTTKILFPRYSTLAKQP
jgi:hypothetical protein